MGWRPVEDTPSPAFRLQARLTAASPDAGLTPIAFLQAPTVQIEGEFGTGLVELYGSNSGQGTLPLAVVQAPMLEPVLPVLWLGVRVTDADAETDVVVTVAGRR